MLEESAASIAHFAWLLAYAATSLLLIAPLFNQAFLGTTLSSTLVYIWGRRNPDVRLSFLGLLTFKAPWLPWVLIAFNVVLHGHWPKDELCGIAVGHGKDIIKMSRVLDKNAVGTGARLTVNTDSMVLLQRHLPLHAPRPPTHGPAAVVDPALRARRALARAGFGCPRGRDEPRGRRAGGARRQIAFVHNSCKCQNRSIRHASNCQLTCFPSSRAFVFSVTRQLPFTRTLL